MPTQITSAGITFNDTTSLTSANGVPSAIKLTTARTINGVAFDGTANITVPATASGANVAKAWVNFNGSTAVIRSSYNVSSVTKNGTGDYTVNFATAMTDANYTANIGAWKDTASGGDSAIASYRSYAAPAGTTTSLRINTGRFTTSGFIDSTYVDLTIFGN